MIGKSHHDGFLRAAKTRHRRSSVERIPARGYKSQPMISEDLEPVFSTTEEHDSLAKIVSVPHLISYLVLILQAS